MTSREHQETLLAISALLFAAVASNSPAICKPLFRVRSAALSGSAPFDAIDAYIEQQMRRLHIPGASLAIVEGDKIVHQRGGFGRARPGGRGATSQTPFFIGSLTKSVTATAVMQLVEASKVELGCPCFSATCPGSGSRTPRPRPE